MSVSVPKVEVHEALSSLSWLTGRWRAKHGEAFYPTMDKVAFHEEIEFLHTGQPVLQYRSQSWHPVKQTLLHLESGYLKIVPGTNKVLFIVAHMFGLTELSEGNVGDNELKLESKKFSRTSITEPPVVLQTERYYTMKEDLLELRMKMGTENHPFQDHLLTVFEKIPE